MENRLHPQLSHVSEGSDCLSKDNTVVNNNNKNNKPVGDWFARC